MSEYVTLLAGRARAARLLSTFTLVATLGCGDDSPPPVPDAAVSCSSADDCSDGLFCNGSEVCDPDAADADDRGCVSSESPCLEGQACSEDDDSCETMCATATDADGDGVDAMECGGTDCDDSDPGRFPGNTEVCDPDGVDEDCDMTTFGERDADSDLELDGQCCNGDLCGEDCNDSRSNINNDTSEVCDRVDNDCDGMIDEGVQVPGFVDADRDGVGDTERPIMACAGARGFAINGGDCDDTRADVRPNWVEICDGVDNNCNGFADEGASPVPWYPDDDADGFGVAVEAEVVLSCEPVAGHSILPGDCDDSNPAVNPGAEEQCNAIDDDCDGIASFVIEGSDTEDDDLDGVPDARCGAATSDCNDLDAFAGGGAELCDGRDNDCDGTVDEDATESTWYVDSDGDGWGSDSGSITDCALVSGRVLRGGDCDDTDASVHPGILEGCEGAIGQDDDCDGTVDETPDQLAVYRDTDEDGWGAGAPLFACAAGPGFSLEPSDCAPSDATVFPTADEQCDAQDGLDNDCDGLVDCDDPDCDGSTACDPSLRLRLPSTVPVSLRAGELATVPFVVEVTDLAGLPASGVPVTATPLGGATSSEGESPSDGSGIARFTLRGSAWPGTAVIRFSTPGARSVFATVTTTALSDGEMFTVINTTKTSAAPSVPGPSTTLGLANPNGLAVAADGTVYVGSSNRVVRVRPNGVADLVAGNGTSGTAGDFGVATAAELDTVYSLAVDDEAGRLYIGTNSRIRAVDLSTGIIETWVGGGASGWPTWGDGGAGTAAQVSNVVSMALTSDGVLYFIDQAHSLVRSVDPTSRLVRREIEVTGSAYPEPELRAVITSTTVVVDSQDRPIVVGARWRGEAVNSSGSYGAVAIFRLEPDGSFTHLAGRAAGSAATDGTPARFADLSSGVASGAAVDSVDNLYFSTSDDRVRRIDAATGRLSTLSGDGVDGSGGDYGPAANARLDNPSTLAIHPAGHLLIVDRSNHAVRAGWTLPDQRRPVLELMPLAPPASEFPPLGFVSLVQARLTAPGGGPVQGMSVDVSSIEPGGAALSQRVDTTATGVASTSARVQLALGTNSFRFTATDAFGDAVTGSPATVPFTVVAPAAGTLFTVVNATKASSPRTTEFPVAASVGVVDRTDSVTVANDGTIYASAGNQVFRVTPGGQLERVAGSGTTGSAGDFGPAADAQLETVTGLAVDDPRQRLYVASAGHIRYVDLADPMETIYPYAGGGTAGGPGYGDGGPASLANLQSVTDLAIATDGTLYLSQSSAPRVRQIDPATGTITLILDTSGNPSSELQMLAATAIAVDNAGRLLVMGGWRGPEVDQTSGGAVPAIVRLEGDGTKSHLLGGRLGLTGDGVAAVMAGLPYAGYGLIVDGSGDIWFSDSPGNRVRRIDMSLSTPTVSTVVGDGTSGTAGDYGSVPGGQVYYPSELALHPDGHVLIADSYNRAIRMIWYEP